MVSTHHKPNQIMASNRAEASLTEDYPTGPVQLETPIRFSDPLPDAVDVVIIGAGIMGVFSALYLARNGKKVLVCEKGRVACEQSSRNWGWIRQQERDEAELPIVTEALTLWEQENKRCHGRLGFQRSGVYYIASTQQRLEGFERWVKISREHGVDCEIISSSQLDKAIDRTDRAKSMHPWIGAMCTPSDARAEPWIAVTAVAELAHSEGAKIIENCAARCLEIEAGRIVGVATEKGIVKCEQVVLAGGAWSSLFARNHKVNMPQLSVRSTTCKTAPLPDFFAGCASDEGLAFRRRQDGGYTLGNGGTHYLYIGPDAFRHLFKYLPVASKHFRDTTFRPLGRSNYPDSWFTKRKWYGEEPSPFETTRALNPEPDLAHVERMRNNFAKRFPDLGKPVIEHAWAGMIDAMPDLVPVVDRVPELPQLIVATGGCGHGFGIGPGIGRIVADMALEKPEQHDLSRFRFDRFTDGSKLVPGPAM